MQAKETNVSDKKGGTVAELKAMIPELVKPKEKGTKEKCRNHLKGNCRFGRKCHFLHSTRVQRHEETHQVLQLLSEDGDAYCG